MFFSFVLLVSALKWFAFVYVGDLLERDQAHVSELVNGSTHCVWHHDFISVHSTCWRDHTTLRRSHKKDVVLAVYRRIHTFNLSIHLLLLTPFQCKPIHADIITSCWRSNASICKHIKPRSFFSNSCNRDKMLKKTNK